MTHCRSRHSRHRRAVVELAFGLAVLARAVHGSQVLSHSVSSSLAASHASGSTWDFVLSPEDEFGTYHYEIPGVSRAANGTAYTFLAHVYLRAVSIASDTGTVLLRGFAYFEQADELAYWRGRLIGQSAAITEVPVPRMRLQPANDEDGYRHVPELELDVTVNANTERPVHLELATDNASIASQHWLTINDWERAASVEDLASHVMPEAVPGSQPRFYFLSFPLWGMRDDQKAYMAKISARWHAALGFDALLLYAYDEQPYVSDPEALEMLQSRLIRLVSWTHSDTGISRPSEPGRDRYDKSVLYNHAILSHWRSNAYLLIADVDEFLAFPSGPMSVQQAYAPGGCMHNASQQARIYRRDIVCASCYEAGGQQAVELQAWDEDRDERVLRRYSLVNTKKDYYKALVLPEAVRHYSIHQGFSMPGYGSAYVRMDCAVLMHAKHMYGYRMRTNIYKEEWSIEHNFVTETGWMWPLDTIQGQRRSEP